MENQQSFWQFSDQLRLHSTGNEEASNRWSFGSSYLNNFANLSINENVWSNSHKENSASNISINDNVWANSHKNNVPNLSINDSGWSNSQNSFPNLSTNEPHKNNVPNLSINDSDWSNSQKNRVPKLSTNDNVWSNSNKGNNVSNLWINDSVWPYINNMNTSETRRNLDTRGGKTKLKGSEMNAFNDGWKHGGTGGYGGKGVITNNNSNKPREISKNNNKSNNNNSNNKNSKGSNNNGNSVEKRFKTLPPSESLPRNETLGGYIFVCNNDTMEDDLRRLLFGLPQRYRDSVRSITPGLPLFLYNYSTHQLHGVFEAASFGGTNIDPTAWEDKKCPGESRFPAQVRAVTRKICKPLEEDSFRPVLHHYDGPKFRLQLNIPEALALLDIFADNNP